jgi:hypothetical protein
MISQVGRFGLIVCTANASSNASISTCTSANTSTSTSTIAVTARRCVAISRGIQHPSSLCLASQCLIDGISRGRFETSSSRVSGFSLLQQMFILLLFLATFFIRMFLQNLLLFLINSITTTQTRHRIKRLRAINFAQGWPHPRQGYI